MIDKKLLETSIESTIRAISKNEKIAVEFILEDCDFENINPNFFLSSNKISLPKISNSKISNLNSIRASGDLAALYFTFHDKKIHQTHQFSNNFDQKLFNDFEKFRLIIKGSGEFKGIANNLINTLENAFDKASSDFLPFLLLENSEIKSTKINHNIENYKKFLDQKLITQIAELKNLVNNQKDFAIASSQLIDFLRNLENKKTAEENSQKKSENKSKKPEENPSINQEKLENKEVVAQSQKEEEIALEDKKESEAKHFDLSESSKAAPEMHKEEFGTNDTKIKFIPSYKAFTQEYDEIVKASDLSNKNELENLRNQLDLKLEKLNKISGKLTAKLKRKLLAKKEIFFERNKEEGLIDRKKISQIITRPLNSNNYLVINEDHYQDTVICLLLDNSGSMRGAPIIMSAMASEIIAKIFENFGIKTEILGFTTSDWRGGKSRKAWEINGKPSNPGRLSDLRHIIYKNANQTFKKSKINLGLMLKEGILKENIDGEALIWAKDRLLNRNEKRKILIVISDGTPVDDSTNSNNDKEILTDHLHQTVARIEKHSDIEVAAIGIGHNVSDFYHNSIMIKNLEDLGDVMINKICDLL